MLILVCVSSLVVPMHCAALALCSVFVSCLSGAACWIGENATDLLKLVCTTCALALALVNSPLHPCCSQESRDGRVDSWRNFQANTKGKKEKKNRTFLRPPKVKMEQRE